MAGDASFAGPDVRFLRDRAGRVIAYASHGEGPLVICPPWWVSHVRKDWEYPPFRAFFERLGAGLRLVRYDRLGVGLSERKAMAASLEEEIGTLDDVAAELGEERYSLFAMSCGGPIGLGHAARHPGRVNRICFYGSFVSGDDLASPEVQAALVGLVHANWGLASRALADIFYPDADRDTVAAMAALTREAATKDMAAKLLQLTFDMSAETVVRSIGCECLVIHRDHERAVPYEAGRRLATELPAARLLTESGSSHPAWFDGLRIADLANAFLRGAGIATAPPPAAAAPSPFDLPNRQLIIGGTRIPLSRLEFGVLQLLAGHPGQLITRDRLLSDVWGLAYEGSNRVDVVISSLRRKLGPWARSIETVTGHGYRLGGWIRR